MLHNVDITYKGNGRALAGQPKPSILALLFAGHLIICPSELLRVCGGNIKGASVSAFLHTICASRAPGEGVIFKFFARIIICWAFSRIFIGSIPTFQFYDAFDDWVFDTYELQ